MYTIYRIRNRVNGKSYIGFTTKNPPEKRFREHIWESKNARVHRHLTAAIRIDGSDNFYFEVLCWGEDHEAGKNIAEPLMIELFPHEYNMTLGGDGVLGARHTEEFKRKQSLRQLGVPKPGTSAGLMGKKNSLGYKMTPELVERLRTRCLGNKYAQGMRHTEEWKLEHSRQLRGVPKPRVICPHCLMEGGASSMKRWHFNHCKKRKS
jgi:group I intron endonuclease